MVFERSTIHCFVGRLNLDWMTIVPNEEVARIFTVPLSTLLTIQPVYYQLDSKVVPECDFPFERLRGGISYPFSYQNRSIPFYEQLSENIWGTQLNLPTDSLKLLINKLRRKVGGVFIFLYG